MFTQKQPLDSINLIDSIYILIENSYVKIINARFYKKPKPENAKILIFKADKAGFEQHVLKDIGIGLPSFSDSAGVQGSVISIELGKINNFK